MYKEVHERKREKMKEKEALKTIYDYLQKGYYFGKSYNFKDLRYAYFDEMLCKYTSHGVDYIGWHNYGSSANENTLRDLGWIIYNVFQTTPSKFLKEYEMRSIYTPYEWETICNFIRDKELNEIVIKENNRLYVNIYCHISHNRPQLITRLDTLPDDNSKSFEMSCADIWEHNGEIKGDLYGDCFKACCESLAFMINRWLS